MVKGRVEVTVKFNELPEARVLGDKVSIELDCDGRMVRATVKAKAWRKAVALTEQYLEWCTSLSGKLGNLDRNGMTVVEAGLQVFEKKPKEAKESTAPEPPITGIVNTWAMERPVLSLKGRE